MTKHRISRRSAFVGIAAFSFVPSRVLAAETIELAWDDLLPEGTSTIPNSLRGIVDHDGASLSSQQPESTGIRTDWNGKTVQLPGFVVPIEYDGTGVTTFLLVPYVGACVHVPPPPANQLVLVISKRPYELEGMFEAVKVTGKLGTASTSTELADVGYVMEATKIAPFG